MSGDLFSSPPFTAQHIGIHEASSTYTPTTLRDSLSVPSVQMLISHGTGAPERGLLNMQMEAAPQDEMAVLAEESHPAQR